jgi:hypothetical protein
MAPFRQALTAGEHRYHTTSHAQVVQPLGNFTHEMHRSSTNLLHQQNTPTTNNTEYSRRSREVVRGRLSGQRTDHNAHTHSTIPGYYTTGLAQATRQRQGHNTARLTFLARHATATVRDTTPGALTASLVPSTHVLYSSGRLSRSTLRPCPRIFFAACASRSATSPQRGQQNTE